MPEVLPIVSSVNIAVMVPITTPLLHPSLLQLSRAPSQAGTSMGFCNPLAAGWPINCLSHATISPAVSVLGNHVLVPSILKAKLHVGTDIALVPRPSPAQRLLLAGVGVNRLPSAPTVVLATGNIDMAVGVAAEIPVALSLDGDPSTKPHVRVAAP